MRAAIWHLLVLGAFAWPGCKPDGRAAACEQDRRGLQALIEADKKNDGTLREADQAMARGQGKQAAELIAQRARPQAQALARRGAEFRPRTRWGAEQHATLEALLEDRVKSLGGYADALASDDLSRVLEQLHEQRRLEQRAIDVDRRLAEPQAIDRCGPP